MCGINGIFAYKTTAASVNRDELRRVRDHMKARGPDGYGEWYSKDSRVGLGHRRLAIIDLSDGGAQPMASGDNKLHIVFNGEIYNYKALRARLQTEGARFRGHSDTEVLLHLYRHYGESMVHELRGMFAFAIWDDAAGSLFLARDPYGIKPLYFCDDGGTFRFASQVKALQAGGSISRELHPAGLTGFFLWGSVPEPFTIYKDIYAVPAGSVISVNEHGTGAPRRYWALNDVIASSALAAETVPRGAECEYLRAAVRDSVAAHMVADVPIGAFLSAGLDSATVVGLAREAGSSELQTITLGFEEFKGKIIDELPLAVEIAKHLDVQHRSMMTSMREVEEEFPRFLNAMDQPTIDGINTWFVSKAAAESGLKVALSGLGGDELLGGYPSFVDIPNMVKRLGRISKIPLLGDAFRFAYCWTVGSVSSTDTKRAGLLKYGGTYEGAYRLQRGIFMPWQLRHVLNKEFLEEGLRGLRALDEGAIGTGSELNDFGKVVALESSRYMRNQLLRDTDWTGMAHSLEIRVPLVDSILTERIVGLAAAGRLGPRKAMLPLTLTNGLPAAALNRPKTGFTVPIWKWLRKSEMFGSWKEIRLLRRRNIRDYSRWAYSLISLLPESRGVLK